MLQDMELYLPSIVTALLLFIGGLWFKNFLPNYFNEKGKLLAQKEDIAEITEKIEGVKVEFTKETEVLKLSLQRLIALETSHRNEERNSIIEFYTKYNQWLYALLEINYGAYSRTNLKDLLEKRIYIERFYGQTGVAQSKVNLLVKDNEIVSLSNKLWIAILQFKGWMDIKLLLLQHKVEDHKFLIDEFNSLIKNFENNKDKALKLATEEKEIKNNLKALVDDFYKTRNNEHLKIMAIDNTFTDKVKGYLTK
jgi:hypothetical protein